LTLPLLSGSTSIPFNIAVLLIELKLRCRNHPPLVSVTENAFVRNVRTRGVSDHIERI
jgi:hypothetical protein